MALSFAASLAPSASQCSLPVSSRPIVTAAAASHCHSQPTSSQPACSAPQVLPRVLAAHIAPVGAKSPWFPSLPRSISVSAVVAAARSSPAPPAPLDMSGKVAVRDTISLTPQEQELFNVLLAATQQAGSNTVLRCAGGWVRDKLLGKDSHDIDIALDNMLGKDFAEQVNQYLKSQGKEVRTAAVIQSNPDQSKHLETARMKINDMWIDLVNLRSETYAQDSRIPEMQFGTAEQDALRRDFTINSLFYNLNQACVEDLTGRGLQDLRDGHIRTPLPPRETFLDDPLRVLRAVRFGTRFGFDLNTDILEAAALPEVRAALGQKVSKERIGTELDGMFNGQTPTAAIRLLHTLSLFPIVFALPPATAQAVGDEYASACVACMQSAEQLLDKVSIQLDMEERRFLLLAALMLPLRACQCPGPKNKPQPAVQYVVRESIKWRAKDADMSVLLHEVAPGLLEVYSQLTAAGGPGQAAAVPESTKVALGTAIRRLKQHWKLGLLLAPLAACKAARPLGVDAGAAAVALPELSNQEEEAARNLEVYSTLLAATEAFELQDCWQWKPLMDGKQVMELLGFSKPGPQLGKAMAAAADWQLVHPKGGAEECRAYLAQWWAANKE